MAKLISPVEAQKAVKAAYKQGRQDERVRFRRTINVMQLSQDQLWHELVRLDKEEPVCGICVSRELAEKLIEVLKKCGKYGFAKKLRKLLNASVEEQVQRLAKELL